MCGKIAHGICNDCKEQIQYIQEPRCMACGKPVTDTEQEYCFDCSKKERVFEQGKNLWVHQMPVSGGIYLFKFHNQRYFGKIFGEELCEKYGEWIRQNHIQEIMPVPLHPKKRRSRGYNQAEILANEIGERLGIPVNCSALVRIKKTTPQKKLNHSDRTKNLQNAFGVRKDWVPAKNVLVVDDIYTTGSTIRKIAKVLKRAGVEKVYFLTISIGQGL